MSHTSSGGVASADYQFDEFERAAALLGQAGEGLAMVRLLVSSALSDAGPPTSTDVWQYCRAAEEHLQNSHTLAIDVGDRLAECRTGIEASRTNYEEAERRARQQAYQVRAATVLARVDGQLASNHGHPDGQTTEDLINAAPGLALAMLATGGEARPDPLTTAKWEVVARLGADRDHGGPFRSSLVQRIGPSLVDLAILRQLLNLRRIQVDSVRKAAPERFNGTLPDLMELQRRAEAQVSGDGAILVTSTQTTAGMVRVLTLPGTQPDGDWRSAGRRNPFDEGGIAEGIGLGSPYIGEAAAQALHDVGAQPGDRLVITGYSQGGIHAANLAVDPQLARAYDVEYVVTAGAPIGGTPLPDGVRGLHFEHAQDMVPGLDGRPNPATSDQVTVKFQGYAPGTDLEAGGFGAAHQLGNYSYLSGEVPGSTDPSVMEARTSLAAVFAGATTATVATVKLRRGPAKPNRPVRRKPVRRPLRRSLRQDLHAAPSH